MILGDKVVLHGTVMEYDNDNVIVNIGKGICASVPKELFHQNETEKDEQQKECNALLQEWKERLGLVDWVIKLEYNCHPNDMSMQDVSGCTEWVESTKSAVIQILDEKYYGDRLRPYDYERTLVHELLHLKTCLVSDVSDSLQERVMHQMIDDLARAFVDAKRAK